MPFQSAFPSIWDYEGKTLYFCRINLIPNVKDQIDDVVASIRSNTSVRRVYVGGRFIIESRINRKKIYEAVFLNERIKEIFVWNAGYGNSHWVSRALREGHVDKLEMDYRNPVFNESDVQKIAQAANRTLKEFTLCRDHPTNRIFVDTIVRRLRFRSCLTSLAFTYITPDTVIQVCGPVLHALVANRTVKKLKLKGDFGGRQNLEFVQQGVTRLMHENTTLEDLSIKNLSSGTTIDVGPILPLLNGNKSLLYLCLSGFRIEGREYAVENNTVTTLNLSGNWIDMQGARTIGGAFSHATALKCLDFSNCNLDDAKLVHICKVLEESGSHDTLCMAGTNIGDDGCMHACEALKQNESVRTLDLSWNRRITNTGVNTLVDCVKAHPLIHEIDVMGTSVGYSTRMELEYYLELNKGPKTLFNARVPLPLSLWHQAFKRADDCRHVTIDGTVQLKAPDMLYYLVKERVDLFEGARAPRGRKRRRRN